MRARLTILPILVLARSIGPAAAQTGEPAAGTQPAVEDSRDAVYYPGDTESIKPLTRKLAGNLFLDQKQLWASPFRMNHRSAGLWIGFGAVTAALIATDHRSSTVFENTRGQLRWAQNLSRVGASYTLLPLVAGFYGYGVFADHPKAREVGVLGGEALLDGLIVSEVLKTATGRRRPDATSNRGEFLNAGDSFPSGHAIESWALASLIAHEYKDTKFVPVVAYGLAGVVSGARFTAQKHYASDIVAGGTMGWFLGRFVYQTHMDHAIHRHGRMPRITPIAQPSTSTFGLALQFGK